MLLLIDNYDSFTYNLAHYLGAWGAEVALDADVRLPRCIDVAGVAVVDVGVMLRGTMSDILQAALQCGDQQVPPSRAQQAPAAQRARRRVAMVGHQLQTAAASMRCVGRVYT